MLGLRELQRDFAQALVGGDAGPLLNLIESDRIPAAERLAVYRRNREGAITSALKLTYPAVAALVGEAFFESTAAAFSRCTPPKSATFSAYGGEYADFIDAHPQTATLPYLGDVARLEWAVAQAASSPDAACAPRSFALGEVALILTPTLALLPLTYPALAIWRAVLDGDEAALAHIDPAPAPATLAVWRRGAGAAVAHLGPAGAAFVAGLLAGVDVETALASAAARPSDAPDVIDMISAEVLQAGFVTLIASQHTSHGARYEHA